MKPSVGRIVHYTGFGDEQKGKCYAALVTGLRMDGVYINSVDLTVFPPDGRQPFTDTDVTGGGNEPGHGQWHWPEREDVSPPAALPDEPTYGHQADPNEDDREFGGEG